jgi:hypothetical protein
MKRIKILSGLCLLVSALLFAGCYTQFPMRISGGYGYSYHRGTQNNQTPTDSNYGNQYGDQNYPDSINSDQYGDQNYPDSSDGIVNNYYGCPPYYGNDYGYNSPYVYGGLYWNSPFYDPFYWDPYGLWAFGPGFYYGAFGFYPYYHNLYYGSYGYGHGLGYGHGGFTQTRGTGNLRNIDGSRSISGINSNNRIPTTTARTLQPRNYGTLSSAGNIIRSTGKINRSMSHQTSQMQRKYYNRGNSYRRNTGSKSTQQNVNRPAPRSYSPPARSYSGGGGRSSSGGGRRGR